MRHDALVFGLHVHRTLYAFSLPVASPGICQIDPPPALFPHHPYCGADHLVVAGAPFPHRPQVSVKLGGFGGNEGDVLVFNPLPETAGIQISPAQVRPD